MRIGVTGASGFVGAVLCRRLAAAGFLAHPIVRISHGLDREIVTGDLSSAGEKALALPRLDAIIHLAARAHAMNESAGDPLAGYRKVNVGGTRRIAEAAKRAGIPHFIFLSSIKVNGESTTQHQPFKESDPPRPEDAYGQSKLEAEAVVQQVYGDHGNQWTIVRSPLVYGPGVKGNFGLLMKLAVSGIPLPLGGIENSRSMIFVDNLADFLVCALNADGAKNEIFLICDDIDLSTGGIVKKIAETSGKHIALLPIPPAWLKVAAKLTGRAAMVDRLVGSLKIDATKARTKLDWSPTYDIDEAFNQTVHSNPKA